MDPGLCIFKEVPEATRARIFAQQKTCDQHLDDLIKLRRSPAETIEDHSQAQQTADEDLLSIAERYDIAERDRFLREAIAFSVFRCQTRRLDDLEMARRR